MCFLWVWGYCGNGYIPFPPSVSFCYPVCTWDRGRYWAAPSLSGALMRTLESWPPAHLLSALCPVWIQAPLAGRGSVHCGSCECLGYTSGCVYTQLCLSCTWMGKSWSSAWGCFCYAAGVSSYPPQGSTFPRSFSHPPRPAASLLPAREEGWSGSLGAWQIGEG